MSKHRMLACLSVQGVFTGDKNKRSFVAEGYASVRAGHPKKFSAMPPAPSVCISQHFTARQWKPRQVPPGEVCYVASPLNGKHRYIDWSCSRVGPASQVL